MAAKLPLTGGQHPSAETRALVRGMLDTMERQETTRTYARDDLAKGNVEARKRSTAQLEIVRLARIGMEAWT